VKRLRRGVSATQNDGIQLIDGTRSAESSSVTGVETVVAWELRSTQTSATVKCVIEEYEGGHCLVRITHADQEVASSWHITRAEAASRVDTIQADLLHTGWDALERSLAGAASINE
jgi:hypothetical protein